MACDRAYCAPGAGGRGWPREGLRGRHTGPGADGEALGAARGWLPGAVDGPRSQALTRRCLGGRATLRGGVGGWGSGCGHRTEPQPRLYTLCPSPSQRHALPSDCLHLKRSKHITPCAPRPPLRSPAAASCARAGDSVRGVDMCRSCIDEGDGNTADTGSSRWRAAGRTYCASAHGARRIQSGPPKLETQRLASEAEDFGHFKHGYWSTV